MPIGYNKLNSEYQTITPYNEFQQVIQCIKISHLKCSHVHLATLCHNVNHNGQYICISSSRGCI